MYVLKEEEKGVVGLLAFLQYFLHFFEHVLGSLLDEHVVVALPSQVDIVVVEESAELAVTAVAVASEHLSALPGALRGEPASLGLEDRRNGMQLFNDGMSGIQNVLLVVVPLVEVGHRCSVVHHCLSKQRHHSPLGEWIVNEKGLFCVVTDLELPSLVAVANADGHCLRGNRAAVVGNHVSAS